MKILFDHCVPKPFRRHLPAHQVRTTREMRWELLRNGALMSVAAKAFEVFLTVDKKIKSEHNLRKLPLPVIVLDTFDNKPESISPFAPFVERELSNLRPGELVEIHPDGSVTRHGAPH